MMETKKSGWRRALAMVLVAALLTGTVPLQAFARQQSENGGGQGNGEGKALEAFTLNPESEMQDLVNGNILQVNDEGLVTIKDTWKDAPTGSEQGEDGEQAPVEVPAEEKPEFKAEMTEDGEDVTITPDYDGTENTYNEEAAKYAESRENLEYVGTAEGTDLSTYEMTPEENAAEFDSGLTDEQAVEIGAYYSAPLPTEDRLQEMLADAEAFAAQVDEQSKDPNFLASLAENDMTDYFRVIKPEGQTQSQNAPEVMSESDYEEYSAESNPQQEIIVIDDSVVLMFVQDAQGNGIDGAAVSLTLPDGTKYQEVSKPGGNYHGMVLFKNLSGIHTGFLDIQKRGYAISTVEDIDLVGGKTIIRKLRPVKDDEMFVRLVNIGKADVQNQSATLYLTESETQKYGISVLVSCWAGADRLENHSVFLRTNRKSGTLKELGSGTGSRSDAYSYLYSFENDWSKKIKNEDAALFRDGDTLDVVYGKSGETMRAQLTVKDAPVEKPFYKDIKLNLLGGGVSFKVPESVPVLGGAEGELSFFEFDFTFLVGLDGEGLYSYNAKIKDAIAVEEFYKEPWLPRRQEKTKTSVNFLRAQLNKKVEMFQTGKEVLRAKDGKGFGFIDGSVGMKVNAVISGSIRYDWDNARCETDVTAILAIAGNFGLTYYVVIPGPVPPVYLGFDLSASAKDGGSLSASFCAKDPLSTFKVDKSEFDRKYGFFLGFGVGLAVYVGAGIRGLLSLEVRGHGQIDGTIDFRKDEGVRPAGRSYPRSTLDLNYGMTLELGAMFFKFGKTWPADTIHLFDSWGLQKMEAPEEPKTTVYEVTYPGGGEAEVPAIDRDTGLIQPGVAQNAGGTGEDLFANGADDSDGYSSVAAQKIGANQKVRYVTVDGVNYIFRIAYVKPEGWWNYYPLLVYQKENPDGKTFENKVYVVPNYGSDWDAYFYDYDFDVMVLDQRLTDHNGIDIGKEVMLTIISGNKNVSDNSPEALSKNTIVRAVRIHMPKNTLTESAKISDARGDGKTYRYKPTLGIGKESNAVAIAWSEASSLSNVERSGNFWMYCQFTPSNSGFYRYVIRSKHQFEGTVTEVCSGPGMVVKGDTLPRSTYALVNLGNKEYGLYATGIRGGAAPLSVETAASNLQPLYADPLAGGKNALLYNGSGLLKLFVDESNAPVILQDAQGKPFSLPKNCITYQYVSGTISGKTAMKLVAICKAKDEQNKTSSSIHIYNIQRLDNGGDVKLIVHGPRSYTLQGQDVNQADVAVVNGKVKVVYTANTVSKVVEEFTGDLEAGTNIKPGKLESSCTLYTWEEPIVKKGELTKLFLEDTLVKKENRNFKATVTFENLGSEVLNGFTYRIEDQYGNTVVPNTVVTKEMYSGELYESKTTFNPLSQWPVGPLTLTAKLVSYSIAGADGAVEEVAVEDEGVSWQMTEEVDCMLELDASDVILGDEHYASVNYSNNSLIPTAENTSLRLYKAENNQVAGGTSPGYTLDVGRLEEGAEVNGEYRDFDYNLMIPLDEYWSDPNCSGVVLELASEGEEKTQTVRAELKNPNAAHRFVVGAIENNPHYGTVTGTGYYLPGTEVTLQAEPNDGYRFVQWVDAEGNVVSADAQYTLTVEESMFLDLEAQFEETGESHLVTLASDTHTVIVNGEEVQEPNGIVMADNQALNHYDGNEVYSVNKGESIQVSASSYPGYLFTGWADEDGNIVSTDEEYSFEATREMTLTAKFQDVAGCYFINFNADANGGITDAKTIWTDSSGHLAELPEASKEGYTFKGWFTAAKGGTQFTLDQAVQANTVLYAQFRPIPDPTFPFTDVTVDDWFYEDVKEVNAKGLMMGIDKSLFAPQLFTDRGMIITTLWRLEGSPAPKASTSFRDVEPTRYYADAVAWGEEKKIALGKGNGLFAPKDPVTREELAVLLHRYAQYKGLDTMELGSLEIFADQPSPWAEQALRWAIGKGILLGKGDDILDPKGLATRAETAAVLLRFQRLQPDQ